VHTRWSRLFAHNLVQRCKTGRLRTTARRFSAHNVVDSVATTTTSSFDYRIRPEWLLYDAQRDVLAIGKFVVKSIWWYRTTASEACVVRSVVPGRCALLLCAALCTSFICSGSRQSIKDDANVGGGLPVLQHWAVVKVVSGRTTFECAECYTRPRQLVLTSLTRSCAVRVRTQRLLLVQLHIYHALSLYYNRSLTTNWAIANTVTTVLKWPSKVTQGYRKCHVR